MVALFMMAIALTGVVGAPLSGWILHQFGGATGLKGWQMLFLVEGIPSITLGPLFWPMPTDMLAGTSAAAGIAWANSLGNLGGFLAPFIVGWFTDLTKRTDYGLYIIAGALVLGSLLVLGFVPRKTV